MGVMTCSRKYCNNIMCDTYISSVGYVCRDCQSEFKIFLQVNQSNPQTDVEIENALKDFMETKAGSFNGQPMSVESFFSNHTR
jgi:hypothetical protein